MFSKPPKAFYVQDIAIPLAKIYHLVVASLQGHAFEEYTDPGNQEYIQDYYKTHNNDRFLQWLSLPGNANIKKIIEDFNEGFILTFAGPTGVVDVPAFLAFRSIFIQYNPLEALGSLATGEVTNLYQFIENRKHNPIYTKILTYLNRNAGHLIWPAVLWEQHTKTTRSQEKYALFSKNILIHAINNITAELPALEDLRNECSFFYDIPAKKQIKAVLKVIAARKNKTLEDFIFTLGQTIDKQIDILNMPPRFEDIRTIVSLRETFSKIKNILKEATLHLEVIAFIYDPNKSSGDDNTFTLNFMP